MTIERNKLYDRGKSRRCPSCVPSMENALDDNAADLAAEMENFVSKLMMQPDREQVASEIGVLQSIYGENAINLWHGSRGGSPGYTLDSQSALASNGTDTIRYVVSLSLPAHEDVSIRILVSAPSSYPTESPPQLQLLSRYVGAFGVDPSLFGSILRTFISISGVEWSPDTVCVFDGLQSILERCEAWYEDKLNKEKVGELIREDNLGRDSTPREFEYISKEDNEESVLGPIPALQDVALPEDIKLVEAEPIVDRKSVFIGRACQISHPSQVPFILNYLTSDRHIARAAHPIINAWRCQVGNVLHQDNNDDGETAAGSRLAHLLSILEINNVLVIVTRWFGGIHLGPDRFKHINHAARNALEMGGFLDKVEGSKSEAKGRKR